MSCVYTTCRPSGETNGRVAARSRPGACAAAVPAITAMRARESFAILTGAIRAPADEHREAAPDGQLGSERRTEAPVARARVARAGVAPGRGHEREPTAGD